MEKVVGSVEFADPEQRMLASMFHEAGPVINRIYSGVLDRVDQSDIRVEGSDAAVQEVVFRHSISLAFAGRAYGVSEEAIVQLGIGVALAYSLPLVVVDRVLDDQPSVTNYSAKSTGLLDLTHRGYFELLKLDYPAPLCELVSGASMKTISAMQDDRLTKFAGRFDASKRSIEWYWSAGKSRINASNLPRVGISSCQILKLGYESIEIRKLGEAIGRLRQVADELTDVCEDARSGLITLPILYALTSTSHRANIEAQFLAVMARDVDDPDICEKLRASILESGAAELVRERSDTEYAAAIAHCWSVPNPEYLIALLCQRRLQINRAIDSGLSDERGLNLRELMSYRQALDWREVVKQEASGYSLFDRT